MTNIVLNASLDACTLKDHDKQTIVEFYVGQTGKKQIIIWGSASLLYVPILIDSEIDFDVILEGEWGHLSFSQVALSPKAPVQSKVVTHLQASDTHADVQLLGLPADFMCSLEGNLDIAKDVSGVSAYLHQHQLVTKSEAVRTLAFPKLTVNSHQVKAGHGASIHQLDPKYLFYLMAKWLDIHQAQQLVIRGHVEHMLDRAQLSGDEKTQVLEKVLPFVHY